jgi:hypothetical protein
MIGYVYTLSSIASGEILYVGCTTMDLQTRLNGHKGGVKLHKSPVYKYIRENKIEIRIEEVERIVCRNKNTLLLAEEYWIEQFRQWGFVLKNRADANMGEMRKRHPLGSGSISVDQDVLKEAKEFCKQTGRFLYGFINDSIKERLNQLKSK